MKVLIACEESGIVREAFRALGHEAFSCDLQASSLPSPYHIQGDVLSVIKQGWDVMIAHPPCTFLNSAGLHWITRGRVEADGRPRKQHQDEALQFVRELMNAPIERIAIENPVGCIGTMIRPADQFIQPYQFGEDASKNTGLWLKNLPLLVGTKYIKPRMIDGKPRWGNQTDSGQNKLGPSADRAKIRSATYKGVALAMAAQWSKEQTFTLTS
jgi:hypothetical protein